MLPSLALGTEPVTKQLDLEIHSWIDIQHFRFCTGQCYKSKTESAQRCASKLAKKGTAMDLLLAVKYATTRPPSFPRSPQRHTSKQSEELAKA